MNTKQVKQIAIALHTETKQGDHLKPPPWKASGNFTQADADACNAAEAAREQAREAGNTSLRQRDAELDSIRLQRLDRIIELQAQVDALSKALRETLACLMADSDSEEQYATEIQQGKDALSRLENP